MRRRRPALRTLPVSTDSTCSVAPISWMLTLFPLKANAEVWEATRKPGICASTTARSSVKPSLKYSFSSSALMLMKGRTAMEREESRRDKCPELELYGLKRISAVGSSPEKLWLEEKTDGNAEKELVEMWWRSARRSSTTPTSAAVCGRFS